MKAEEEDKDKILCCAVPLPSALAAANSFKALLFPAKCLCKKQPFLTQQLCLLCTHSNIQICFLTSRDFTSSLFFFFLALISHKEPAKQWEMNRIIYWLLPPQHNCQWSASPADLTTVLRPRWQDLPHIRVTTSRAWGGRCPPAPPGRAEHPSPWLQGRLVDRALLG